MPDVLIRELQERDLWNGFLESLDSLRHATGLERDAARMIFEKISSNPSHTVLVAQLGDKIVGCATILVEQKFIHGGKKAAHIEDVAVSAKHQRTQIGTKIIAHALDYAKAQGCYKTVLYCSNDVMPFYEKLGFKPNANSLRFDH